jgi:UDP-xylose/UDP-N-acetylglucosamine transporter B4
MVKDLVHQAALVSSTPSWSLVDLFRFLGFESISSLLPPFLHSFAIPQLWFFVLCNAFTQYICISGVHQLTSVASSLTVNLILTFRKFVSLLISIYYFRKQFGIWFWVGCGMVFLGILLYSMASQRQRTMSRVRTLSGRWKSTEALEEKSRDK